MRLIHWNAAEAQQRAAPLAAAGYAVDFDVPTGMGFLKALRANPPAAVVIDLNRLPMQGRDLALAIRQSGKTRRLPLVFVEGAPQKVARVRKSLPDAVFTEWKLIRSSLEQAIKHPAANPIVPSSLLAGYSGTPLPKKLGIKPNAVVALMAAPKGFRQTLGVLPEGATLRPRTRSRADLTIWFLRSQRELQRRVGAVAGRSHQGPLWIAWPKKSSGVATDLSEPVVREAGLAAGMVDYKICAIDTTWSGLLFSRRKRQGARP
ncbi:MAG: hypothetical protein ACRD4D_01540 [Candidatus Acidiferrales bacterium]